MTSPWPSDTPGGRRTKAPKARQAVPTDWVTGWAVTLFVVAVVAAVGLFVVWPLAAGAMEQIQTLSDTLAKAARNLLA
jgi:hypothetical protein